MSTGANIVFRCSRCKAERRTSWKPSEHRPCVNEACAGVMRHVRVAEERKDERARRELAQFETRTAGGV